MAGFDRGNFVGGGLELGGTSGAEDGTGDPAAHGEVGVGGVDEGVDWYFGDVLADEGEGHGGELLYNFLLSWIYLFSRKQA
ncbi:hypothetical protein [Schleiferilactobacillus harbinensis]|uniref:hypothetical protein n=1 Tax=Schleiferilactobacillus harbinensis TaxID=304207 RepID=UPI0039EB8E88